MILVLCGDCGTAGASAAMADYANHNQMAQSSFADVVCRINIWVCGKTKEVFKVTVREIVHEPSYCCVLIVAVGELYVAVWAHVNGERFFSVYMRWLLSHMAFMAGFCSYWISGFWQVWLYLQCFAQVLE